MQDPERMMNVKGDQSDGRGAGIDNLLYSDCGGASPPLETHIHPQRPVHPADKNYIGARVLFATLSPFVSVCV
eukprot:scaffold53284_cov33-Tisochrysis_lutea.AAC.4